MTMAKVISCFTEKELTKLQLDAIETGTNVQIECDRFGMLARAFLDLQLIKKNLRESGKDTSLETGGVPHAVSRLLGESLAMQRMAEGAGVVPVALLVDILPALKGGDSGGGPGG